MSRLKDKFTNLFFEDNIDEEIEEIDVDPKVEKKRRLIAFSVIINFILNFKLNYGNNFFTNCSGGDPLL